MDGDPGRGRGSETLQIGLAVVIAVSAVGFAVGLSPTDRTPPLRDAAARPAAASEATVPAARSYTELRDAGPYTPAAGWTEAALALASGLPDRGQTPPLGGDLAAALQARADRRAYDGAPPTVPHPVRQGAAAECLVCHDLGASLNGRVAPAMSHESMTSCTQCHVVEAAPMPAQVWMEGGPWAAGNSFVGLESPSGGERAWSIAPPVMPHQSFMRERCESCHGVAGSDPIRTSHPWRQSCQQCHAASAAADRLPGMEHIK